MAIFGDGLILLFWGSKPIFHLQITSVCYNITSPVMGKPTDLVFKFGKNVGLSILRYR